MHEESLYIYKLESLYIYLLLMTHQNTLIPCIMLIGSAFAFCRMDVPLF